MLKYAKTYARSSLRSGIFWAAFLFVSVAIVFSVLKVRADGGGSATDPNFGGPIETPPDSYVYSVSGGTAAVDDAALGNLFVSESGVIGGQNPLIGMIPLGNGIVKYKVKKGDTVSGIAEEFRTVAENVQATNGNALKSVRPGDWVIIATVVTSSTAPSAGVSNLPDLKNYFSLPAVGWNWGQLHDYNAVDIANQCGTPVSAAAEGLVISDPNLGDGSSGWNDGYGVFVFIEHPNGTKTRYAHLAKALTKIGDYVKKGQEIGLMGNTGNTHGPTGCHLHFEVYGAKNPFAIQ